MDEFSLQIKTVCLVSIFTGVMSVLIPAGKLKKAFNSFCAIVIIFSVMLPFTSLKKAAEKGDLLDISRADGELLSQNSSAEQLIYTKVIEKAINDRLTEMDISAAVRVQCKKEDESFTVTSFTVVADTDEDREKTRAYLTEGFDGATINFEEDEDG